MSKYDHLMDAANEYREARAEELPNYDPQNYAQDRRDKRRAAAESALDAALKTVVLGILKKGSQHKFDKSREILERAERIPYNPEWTLLEQNQLQAAKDLAEAVLEEEGAGT